MVRVTPSTQYGGIDMNKKQQEIMSKYGIKMDVLEAEGFHLLHKAITIINEDRIINPIKVLDLEIGKAVNVLLNEDKESFELIGSNL